MGEEVKCDQLLLAPISGYKKTEKKNVYRNQTARSFCCNPTYEYCPLVLGCLVFIRIRKSLLKKPGNMLSSVWARGGVQNHLKCIIQRCLDVIKMSANWHEKMCHQLDSIKSVV